MRGCKHMISELSESKTKSRCLFTSKYFIVYVLKIRTLTLTQNSYLICRPSDITNHPIMSYGAKEKNKTSPGPGPSPASHKHLLSSPLVFFNLDQFLWVLFLMTLTFWRTVQLVCRSPSIGVCLLFPHKIQVVHLQQADHRNDSVSFLVHHVQRHGKATISLLVMLTLTT